MEFDLTTQIDEVRIKNSWPDKVIIDGSSKYAAFLAIFENMVKDDVHYGKCCR